MASINGVSLKNITSFKGHDGEPLAQGNLYVNNKKIGFWSQDSHGGPDYYDLDLKYDVRLLNQAVISRNQDKAFHGTTDSGKLYTVDYDMDLLLYDFLSLRDDEKEFAKAVKQGYSGIMIATDGFHQVAWKLPATFTDMSDDKLLEKLASQIDDAKKTFWEETEHTKHAIKIYRSPADFVIGEPIKLEEIMKKRDLNKTISTAEAKTTKAKHMTAGKTEPER